MRSRLEGPTNSRPGHLSKLNKRSPRSEIRRNPQTIAYCAANNIGYIPWSPLAAGELTGPGGTVDRIAEAHGATAGQVALAWLLQRSPVILPITGTLRVAHLGENVAAGGRW